MDEILNFLFDFYIFLLQLNNMLLNPEPTFLTGLHQPVFLGNDHIGDLAPAREAKKHAIS
jgi:hypothetical protein